MNNKLIKLLILGMVFCVVMTHFNDRHSSQLRRQKKFFEEQLEEKDRCKRFNNCNFYQVNNETYNDYGCALCDEGYQLSGDEFGSGVCKVRQSIPHCIWESQRPDKNNGEPVCWMCTPEYVLNTEFDSCSIPFKKSYEIKYCENYWANEKGEVLCNKCKNGYTLSEDQTTCTRGCNIENCSSCQIISGKLWCYQCNRDYIGTYNSLTNFNEDCITCKKWQMLLLTPKYENVFNKEKHDDDDESDD